MYIIAGLGNPGKKYQNTRHNMGFITLDLIAEKLNIKVNRIKYKSLIGEGEFNGEKIILVKPQTFMNASGEAIREIMNFYKLPSSDLLIIYDDMDIPLGDIRLRPFGSAGTHNGMKSVIYQLADDKFPRIRIGIGKASEFGAIEHVIGSIKEDEIPILKEACTKACDAACCYLEQGLDIAMNRFNSPKKNKE